MRKQRNFFQVTKTITKIIILMKILRRELTSSLPLIKVRSRVIPANPLSLEALGPTFISLNNAKYD
jgi:hypothetical protein